MEDVSVLDVCSGAGSELVDRVLDEDTDAGYEPVLSDGGCVLHGRLGECVSSADSAAGAGSGRGDRVPDGTGQLFIAESAFIAELCAEHISVVRDFPPVSGTGADADCTSDDGVCIDVPAVLLLGTPGFDQGIDVYSVCVLPGADF